MSDWWNGIGLQRKLQILIQGFLLIVFVVLQQWMAIQFEERVLSQWPTARSTA